MEKTRLLVFYVLPVLIFLGLIFFTSSQPQFPGISSTGVNLSWLHIPIYFILAYLLLRIFKAVEHRYAFQVAILLAVLVGVADELYQGFVPGRTTSITDLLLDALGSSLVLLFRRFSRLLL